MTLSLCPTQDSHTCIRKYVCVCMYDPNFPAFCGEINFSKKKKCLRENCFLAIFSWWVLFNDMSSHQVLFYALILGNRIHFMFIFKFFGWLRVFLKGILCLKANWPLWLIKSQSHLCREIVFKPLAGYTEVINFPKGISLNLNIIVRLECFLRVVILSIDDYKKMCLSPELNRSGSYNNKEVLHTPQTSTTTAKPSDAISDHPHATSFLGVFKFHWHFLRDVWPF